MVTEEPDLAYLFKELVSAQADWRKANLEHDICYKAMKEGLQQKYGRSEEDITKKIVIEDPSPRSAGSVKTYWIISYHVDTGCFDMERAD